MSVGVAEGGRGQRMETAAACPDKHLFNMTIKTSQTANAHGAYTHTQKHTKKDLR